MYEKFIALKKEFAQQYNGNSHIQEILPSKPSRDIPVNDNHLTYLHKFAKNNPIYYNSFTQEILGVECVVYEGDINTYWLDSIKHGSSCQPFYPTWILSAYIAALKIKDNACKYLVDIGSGDGRIAYCGSILGLDSHSVEIDENLTKLQSDIIKYTDVNFKCTCADATRVNFSHMCNTAFFIGGLPQMGGDILAESVIKQDVGKNSIFVFAGSHSKRNLARNTKNGGWDNLIKKYGLEIIDTISLPTVWTFDQKENTPYIFTKL